MAINAAGYAPVRRALSLQDIRQQAMQRNGGKMTPPGRTGGPPLTIPGVAGPTSIPVQPQAPVTPSDRYAGFEATPGYQFRMDEGARAIENSAAARGRLFSGGTIKGLTRYSQGVASDEFQNYVRGLQSLAGAGQTAVGRQGAFGASTAGNIGSAYQRAGEGTGSAYARGAEGVGNALIGGIGNLAYIYGNRQPAATGELQPFDLNTLGSRRG